MNIRKIVRELKVKYPGKNIVKNNKPVTEIICEIDPISSHSEYSIAVAVIDKSFPHFHKKAREIYEVIKGVLIVYKNRKKYILRKGEKLLIEPGVIHWAEGNQTWIKTISNPGWRVEDHILFNKISD